MPRYICVQIEGVEKFARVEADEVDNEQAEPGLPTKTILLKGGKRVGEFFRVIGWWIVDD